MKSKSKKAAQTLLLSMYVVIAMLDPLVDEPEYKDIERRYAPELRRFIRGKPLDENKHAAVYSWVYGNDKFFLEQYLKRAKESHDG